MLKKGLHHTLRYRGGKSEPKVTIRLADGPPERHAYDVSDPNEPVMKGSGEICTVYQWQLDADPSMGEPVEEKKGKKSADPKPTGAGDLKPTGAPDSDSGVVPPAGAA